jgi:hypothetical protein
MTTKIRIQARPNPDTVCVGNNGLYVQNHVYILQDINFPEIVKYFILKSNLRENVSSFCFRTYKGLYYKV